MNIYILGDGKPKPNGTLDYYGVNDPSHKPFKPQQLEKFSVSVFEWQDGKRGKEIKRFGGYKDGAFDVYKHALVFIRNPVPTEYEEQKKVIKWARESIIQYPELKWLYCSLNGLNRPEYQSSMAIAQGMVKGVPDLHLPVARRGYTAWWGEMKRAKRGRLEPEQKEFIEFVQGEGAFAIVPKGAEECIKSLQWYLSSDLD